jgi:hypothetical protein
MRAGAQQGDPDPPETENETDPVYMDPSAELRPGIRLGDASSVSQKWSAGTLISMKEREQSSKIGSRMSNKRKNTKEHK